MHVEKAIYTARSCHFMTILRGSNLMHRNFAALADYYVLTQEKIDTAKSKTASK